MKFFEKNYVLVREHELREVFEWCREAVGTNDWHRQNLLYADGSELVWFREHRDIMYLLLKYGQDAEILPYTQRYINE